MPDEPSDTESEAPPPRHYDAFLKNVMTRRWSDRLTARMDALDVSSSELSRLTGVSITSISLFRQGKRTPGEASRLAMAVALGADVEQVFPNPVRKDYLDFVERLDGSDTAATAEVAA